MAPPRIVMLFCLGNCHGPFLCTGLPSTLEIIILLQQFWIFYSAYAFLYFLFLASGRKKLYSIPLLLITFGGSYAITQFFLLCS